MNLKNLKGGTDIDSNIVNEIRSKLDSLEHSKDQKIVIMTDAEVENAQKNILSSKYQTFFQSDEEVGQIKEKIQKSVYSMNDTQYPFLNDVVNNDTDDLIFEMTQYFDNQFIRDELIGIKPTELTAYNIAHKMCSNMISNQNMKRYNPELRLKGISICLNHGAIISEKQEDDLKSEIDTLKKANKETTIILSSYMNDIINSLNQSMDNGMPLG